MLGHDNILCRLTLLETKINWFLVFVINRIHSDRVQQTMNVNYRIHTLLINYSIEEIARYTVKNKDKMMYDQMKPKQ